jgi:hypothetical protein
VAQLLHPASSLCSFDLDAVVVIVVALGQSTALQRLKYSFLDLVLSGYASLLIEQGGNIKYIQTQLGHSSPFECICTPHEAGESRGGLQARKGHFSDNR